MRFFNTSRGKSRNINSGISITDALSFFGGATVSEETNLEQESAPAPDDASEHSLEEKGVEANVISSRNLYLHQQENATTSSSPLYENTKKPMLFEGISAAASLIAPLNSSERRRRRCHENNTSVERAKDFDIEEDFSLQETEHSKISSKLSKIKQSDRPSTVQSLHSHRESRFETRKDIAEEKGVAGATATGGVRQSNYDERRGSTRFANFSFAGSKSGKGGEEGFFKDELAEEREEEEEAEANWNDVCRACCCHTFREWLSIFMGVSGLFGFLYFFLVGLDLLGTSFKVVGGCTAGSILGDDMNPIASLMIGIIATTLLQSSSTVTAIIVSMVSGGLDIHQAIYMVMGANVGTSVTSIIVTIAHLGDGDELERAFAGAVVNFVFKLLTVIILFPIEVTLEYLYVITKAMLPSSVGEGDKWEGPVKKMVSPLVQKIIIANNTVIERIAEGKIESCNILYPVTCQGGIESYDTCRQGLIGCDKDNNECPAFFENGASKSDDMVSGGVCLFLALFLLIVCLIGLVTLLRKMMLGVSTRIIYKATDINAYVAMLIGCGVTVLVQSSSITTSTLVPLAGMGVLKLEQMYPLTIGADIGTTFTALMAAMVSSKLESLQVALAHLFFNLTGAALWYPIPFMRRIPLNCARKLGKATRIWRGFPFVFILVMFFLVPLILLGISALFEQNSKGFTVLGIFFLVMVLLGLIYFVFWWKFKDGKAKCIACMAGRQRRRVAISRLPDDMDYLKCDMEYVKNDIVRLKDIAGLVEQGYLFDKKHDSERATSVGSIMSGYTTDADTRAETATLSSVYDSCKSKKWLDILAKPIDKPSNQSVQM